MDEKYKFKRKALREKHNRTTNISASSDYPKVGAGNLKIIGRSMVKGFCENALKMNGVDKGEAFIFNPYPRSIKKRLLKNYVYTAMLSS